MNGTFFQSAETMNNSKYDHVAYIPIVAIFVATVGVNMLDVSVILAQILFLYNLFNSINYKFEELIASGSILFPKFFINQVPIIPIVISMSLHIAYISPASKFKSLISRILYSVTYYTVTAALGENTRALIITFIVNYVLMQIFSRLYLSFRWQTLSVLLAFSGTYFFLKTYNHSRILSSFSSRVFDFSLERSGIFNTDSLISNAIFFLLSAISLSLQLLIDIVLHKITGKVKIQ